MEKKQRFALRKFKNGVASVAIGALLVSASAIDVEASTSGEGVQGDLTEEVVETPDAVEGKSEKIEPLAKNVQNVNENNNDDVTPSVESEDLVVQVDTGETEEVVVSEPVVERHEGADREEVAINVAEAHFSDAEKVILVNQDTYTDAISATNISQGEFPVLYTRAGTLGDKTFNYLQEMKNLKEIYLLGGKTSISEAVEKRLTDEFTVNGVTRIGGADRFEANANAIRERFIVGEETEEEKIQADHVVIATGEIYTDALYGVSYANTINAPIILSRTSSLVDESIKLIKDLGVTKVTIVGGEASVTKDVVEQLEALDIELEIDRIAGKTRYDGSAAVAKNAYKTPETVLVASGDIFTDALVSAPLAQKLNAPILLVRKDSMVEEVEKYLNDFSESIETIYIQGGTSTINKANENDIKYAASEKESKPIIIDAVLTLQATDENTATIRFVNEDEEYDETETINLDVALVDGEERNITFEYAGREYTVPALYVTAETFVSTARDLARVSEIEEMDSEELAETKLELERARKFYNALTEEAQADADVIKYEGFLTTKEAAVEAREAELDEA